MGANDNGIEIPASVGRAYARRVVLLERAQIKLGAAIHAEHADKFELAKRFRLEACQLFDLIGRRFLMIDPERVK